MTIDQATADLLEQMAAAGGMPLHEMTAKEARAFVSSSSAQTAPGPDMATVWDRRVPASGGFVPVRVLVPNERPYGVIVYYHGGGWVVGSKDLYDPLGRHLAAHTGCAVVLVDYRLAPEFRFPTAADDAMAALRWASARVEEIAGRTVPLIVAGDSAGGNLAAVVALRSRESGEPSVVLQVLVYPVTDCVLDTTSYLDPENQLMLNRDAMAWFWDQYVPDAAARSHPDASPLRSPSFARVAPAVVVTAEHDVLRDEGEVYALRLMQAGVPVQQQRFEGQMHGFFSMVDVLPGAKAAHDYVADAIARRLAELS